MAPILLQPNAKMDFFLSAGSLFSTANFFQCYVIGESWLTWSNFYTVNKIVNTM